MEKKGNRSVQPLLKGVATESKKNQDGVSSKVWPKSGRRREPASASLSSKNESSRKPIPQRNKTIDKRPRPRGNYYTGAPSGKEDTRLEEHEAELGSVFVQGSKKQSLNHLLNFHYAPREGHCHLGRLNNSKLGHRWNTTLKHKYNKEHFLQANCQFIVKTNGDYKAYLNNPDTLVNWDLIEQVNVQVLDFPACPICLYPPVAAKMTRCGHIYCWSCVLHYLALSDKTWRKCPICFEAVHKNELKSVVPIPHSSFNINENITFRLMKRARGSLTAYIADAVIQNDDIMFNMSEVDTQNIYSKLLLANKNEVLSIIERERKELEKQLMDDENCAEKCFIEEALKLLTDRKAAVLLNKGNVVENLKNTLTNMHLTSVDEESFEKLEVEAQKLNFEHVAGSSQQPSKYFYFYQACDGQHIYLHPLNVRMLEYTYGSLEASPKTITGRIMEKEGGSMTEDLRKRLRYLQHLPVTCQFEVAEIQLKEPVVSKETLDHFSDQIEIRKKRRQRRVREERRREKRIAEEENIKMGKYPVANIHIDSHYQFPDFGSEPVSFRQRTESESTPRSERSLSPSLSSHSNSVAGSLTNDYSGPSFAQMLTTVKTRTTWPDLKSTKPIAAPKLIPVTGGRNNTFTSITTNQSDTEPESEYYVPVPAFNQSFGDAIAMALEKASKNNDIAEPSSQNEKKKKKKKKQKVLFATSMVYSGN